MADSVKIIFDAIDNTKGAINSVNNEIEKVSDSLKSLAAQDPTGGQLNKSFDSINDQLQKTGTVVDDVSTLFDESLVDSMYNTDAAAKKLEKELPGVSDELKKTGKSAEEAGGSFTSVVKGVAKFGAAALAVAYAAGRAYKAIVSEIKSFQEEADKTGKFKTEAALMTASVNALDKSWGNLKSTMIALVAVPLSDFFNSLAQGIEGSGGMATYLKYLQEIEAIAKRLRAERGVPDKPVSPLTIESRDAFALRKEGETKAWEDAREEWKKGRAELEALGDNAEITTENIVELTNAALQAASAINQVTLSSVANAQNNFDNLRQAQKKFTEGVADAKAELADTGDIDAYNAKIKDLEGAYDDAREGSKRWVNGFIVDMMTMMAMADGIMTSPEMKGILAFMVAVGAIDSNLAQIMLDFNAAVLAGDAEAIDKLTKALNDYNNAAGAVPENATIPIPKPEMPKPIRFKKGEPIYDDAEWAAYIAALDEYNRKLKDIKESTDAIKPINPRYKEGGPQPSQPVTKKLPTKTEAQATQEAADGLTKIADALAKVNIEAANALKGLMQSITALVPTGLDGAIKDMKKLFEYNGKTIDIYTTNHITNVTDGSNGSGEGAQGNAPTPGGNYYGQVTNVFPNVTGYLGSGGMRL